MPRRERLKPNRKGDKKKIPHKGRFTKNKPSRTPPASRPTTPDAVEDVAPPPVGAETQPWVPPPGDLLFANMGNPLPDPLLDSNEEMDPVPLIAPPAEYSDDPGELLSSDVVGAAASSLGG